MYVAGPITGDPWGCVRRAVAVYGALAAEGVTGYLPQLSVLHEMIAPQPYERWMVDGLAMVERCDGLMRLSGDSPGADREVLQAETLGLPVFQWGNGPALGEWTDQYHAWLDDVRTMAGERWLSAGRRLTIRNQTDLALGRHPATGRPLIESHHCGQCVHFVNSPPYFKCGRHRLGQSRSAASDIRKSWPACDLFQTGDR